MSTAHLSSTIDIGASYGLPPLEYAPTRRAGIHRLSRYELTDQIGEGTYGKVFKARDRRSGQLCALKRMLPHHEDEGFPRTETREIKILKSVAHPNMVKLIEVVTSLGDPVASGAAQNQQQQQQQQAFGTKRPRSPQAAAPGTTAAAAAAATAPAAAAAASVLGQASRSGDIYMVFKYVDYDFAGLLEGGYRFSEAQIKSYTFQLLSVLDFLHGRGFVHRDLKCANLLLTDDNRLKLGDFGLSRALAATGDPMTNTVITLWYRPPELLLGAREYGPAVDMWSVGCILLELLTGKPPFPARTEAEQLKNIFSVIGTPSVTSELRALPGWGQVDLEDKHFRLGDWLSRHPAIQAAPDARNLLLRLLEGDPRKRIGAREAMSARWFNTDPKIVREDPTYVLSGAAGAAAAGLGAAVGGPGQAAGGGASASLRGGQGQGGAGSGGGGDRAGSTTQRRYRLPTVSSHPCFQHNVDHHEFAARERRRAQKGSAGAGAGAGTAGAAK